MVQSQTATSFADFLHNYTLGRRAFDIRLAPEPTDIRWMQMDNRTHQFIKKMISDTFFAATLIFTLTSGNLIVFIEVYMSPDSSEPSALTKLLNYHPWFRATFHIGFAEVWAQLLAIILDFGYWTCKRFVINGTDQCLFNTQLINVCSLFLPASRKAIGDFHVRINCLT